MSSIEQVTVQRFPNDRTVAPSVSYGESLPYTAKFTFGSLLGRVIVVIVFALAWFMQGVRGILEHRSMTDALWESLGGAVVLLPAIAFFAWVFWQLLFKGQRGLFALSLAVTTAMFSAYFLAVGWN